MISPLPTFHRTLCFLLLAFGLALLGPAPTASATSNYDYKPGEYVTIRDGRSPDGRYALAAHGDGDMGYTNFRIYLMDGRSGKKIGPLTEIKEILDTSADAYIAKWSADSGEVSILYRQERHKGVEIRYRLKDRRAFLIFGPR